MDLEFSALYMSFADWLKHHGHELEDDIDPREYYEWCNLDRPVNTETCPDSWVDTLNGGTFTSGGFFHD